jgi:hypothetical protein
MQSYTMECAMKYTSLVPMLFLFLTLCAAPPRFTLEVREHDFGPIPQGSQVSTTFIFTNTGESALTIGNIRSG